MTFLTLDLGNRELEILLTQGGDFHIIFIFDLELDLEGLVIGGCSRYLYLLDTQLVIDDNCRVGAQLDRATELFGFLLLGWL